jgi:hypothetical protein
MHVEDSSLSVTANQPSLADTVCINAGRDGLDRHLFPGCPVAQGRESVRIAKELKWKLNPGLQFDPKS